MIAHVQVEHSVQCEFEEDSPPQIVSSKFLLDTENTRALLKVSHRDIEVKHYTRRF